MGFEFAKIIAKLGEGVAVRGELVGREDGFIDMAGTPASELSAAMEQDFHEAEHAGVLDLDTRDFGASRRNGESQALEEGEIDVDIQGLGLKVGKTIGDRGQGLTDAFQVFQGLVQSKIFQVVA